MSDTPKIEVLDLIIKALVKHENTLAEFIHRLELVTPSEEGISY